MPIQITTYQPQHKEQIINLILPIQQIEFKVPITFEEQPDLQIIDQFYQTKNGNFWVAVDGNKVVGTIALIDSGEGVGTLRKMFVHADYRGKELGVAANLLQTLLNWAKGKGFLAVYLGTAEILKAAQRFYVKSGFVLIDVNDLPPQFPRMSVDTLFYEYIL